MHIERVASTQMELGELTEDWLYPDAKNGVSISLWYESHDDDGENTYPGEIITTKNNRGFDLSEGQQIREFLTPAISEVDQLVRTHRGYPDNLKTTQIVDYRFGFERGVSSLLGAYAVNLQSKFKLPFNVLLPGPPHFDRAGPPDYEDDRNTVIVSSGAQTTIIYEGVTWSISAEGGRAKEYANLLSLHRLSRFFTMRQTRTRPGVATLINQNTLHRAPGYLESSKDPSYFLRVNVSPEW